MDGSQFLTGNMYSPQMAMASGGAMPAVGMPPYPLYGIPASLGTETTQTPFYRENWFWALVGAGSVGAAWAYFGWWKKRSVTSNASRGRSGSQDTEFRVYPSTVSNYYRTFYTRADADKYAREIEAEYPNVSIAEMPSR